MIGLKIIINATNIGEKLDGVGVYSLNLLKALSKLETDLKFIVILNKKSKQHINAIPLPENFKIKWVSGWLSPDYGFRGHLLRLIYSNYLSLRYKKYLIFNTSALEAILFRSNQIITIHDVIPLLFRQLHFKQYPYFKYLLKNALRSSRAIISPSIHTKNLLENIYQLDPEKIHVINNGIQDIILSHKDTGKYISDKENIILYVGRLSPTKNISGLIKAFHSVRNKIHHSLVIVGSGKDKFLHDNSMKQILVEIDNRIVFKDHLASKELIDLYSRAALFVFPSFYEGFGFPPLEAMACGCPVVVSNLASLPEVCGDAAYYVDPHNVDSIAEGIYKVLTDDTLRQSLIEKGFERVKIFSWEKSAKEYLKVFDAILHYGRL